MSLTKKQQAMLDAIVFFLQKGELPTVREVGALVGLRSPATALKHLRALEQFGLISLNGKSRGIRLLQSQLLWDNMGSDGLPSKSQPQESTKARDTSLPPAWKGLGAFSKAFRPTLLPFQSAPEQISPRIPLAGAIAAGKPFESYSDGFGFIPDGVSDDGLYQNLAGATTASATKGSEQGISMDPRMFVESGEVFALQVEGDSMVNAGILDGDFVIIRRQSEVEEGEIAAVIINGEGTLKRWRTHRAAKSGEKQGVSLLPANDRFDPIEISADDAKEVLVIGKYVGLVRGNLRFL